MKKSEFLLAQRTTVRLSNWLLTSCVLLYVWIRYMIFFPFPWIKRNFYQKWWWKGMYFLSLCCTHCDKMFALILMSFAEKFSWQCRKILLGKSLCSFLLHVLWQNVCTYYYCRKILLTMLINSAFKGKPLCPFSLLYVAAFFVQSLYSLIAHYFVGSEISGYPDFLDQSRPVRFRKTSISGKKISGMVRCPLSLRYR